MVGYKKEKRLIIDRLVRGSKSLKVVTITGMPGIGKTSLALDLFSDRSTAGRFQKRLWCTVSQVFRKNEVLLDLLHQISNRREDIKRVDTRDLQETLRRSLKGQKYLIVMDDVWSSGPWDFLKSSFPNDNTGSRILVTSCLYDIISGSYSQPLQGLSDDESWQLLKMKLLHEKADESHPMDEILRQIAKSCKGLPSAISSVADILSNIGVKNWRQFSDYETSGIVNGLLEQYWPTFELSYRHLRNPLKQCFLYFGVCPRDQDISVRRLLWLWIAEGIIENVESRSSEDVAGDYLKELIDWNFVTVLKRRSDGKVKTCKVHDHLLDFCLFKAKEANFLQLVSGEPSYGSLDDASSSIDSEFRVSICGDPQEFISSKPSGPNIRSLLLFSTNDMYPGCDSDVSFISAKMKLVKVVDLESVNVGSTMEGGGIELPQNLRYMAFGGDMISIPSSLPKLQDLEFLIVKGLMNKFILPSSIWFMKSLRHIQVSNHCIFTLQTCTSTRTCLESLVSLSMPSFSYSDEETNDILERLPNLKTLKCVLLEPCVGSMQISQFPKFGYLLQYLESLKLSYSGWPLGAVEWNLPSGLTQLTLSNFRLPWHHISALSMVLPNLVVLKLISSAFEGRTWDMSEGEFQRLRYLKLESLNIKEWLVYDELPILTHLVIRNCKQLQEVPSCFGLSATLQNIEVHQCGISAQESAEKIIEDLVEYGSKELISSIS